MKKEIEIKINHLIYLREMSLLNELNYEDEIEDIERDLYRYLYDRFNIIKEDKLDMIISNLLGNFIYIEDILLNIDKIKLNIIKSI